MATPTKERNYKDNWFIPMIMDQGQSDTCVRYALAAAIYSQCYYIYLNKAIASKDSNLIQQIQEATRDKTPHEKSVALNQESICHVLIHIAGHGDANHPLEYDDKTITVTDIFGRVFSISLSISRQICRPREDKEKVKEWGVRASNTVLSYNVQSYDFK